MRDRYNIHRALVVTGLGSNGDRSTREIHWTHAFEGTKVVRNECGMSHLQHVHQWNRWGNGWKMPMDELPVQTLGCIDQG